MTTGEIGLSIVGELVEEAIDFARRTYDTGGAEPKPGSQAYRELNEHSEKGPEGHWGRRPIEQAYNVASLLYGASNQYLRTFRIILHGDVPLFGFQAVTRALLEAAGRSWWILDPDCGVRKRVERAYDELYYSYREMQNAARAKGGEFANAMKRETRLLIDAARLGLTQRTEKGSPFGRVVGIGEPRQTSTDLVALFLSDLELEDGEFWYRLLCGVVHSALYAQVGYWEIAPAGHTGVPRVQAQRPEAAIRQAAILCVSAYYGAIERHALLCGGGWEQLRAERHSVVARIRALNQR